MGIKETKARMCSLLVISFTWIIITTFMMSYVFLWTLMTWMRYMLVIGFTFCDQGHHHYYDHDDFDDLVNEDDGDEDDDHCFQLTRSG